MFPVGPSKWSMRKINRNIKEHDLKVAVDHPKSWFRYLGHALWALREIPNQVTGVPPWLMVFGRLPRGPLAVLKENWTGLRDLPLSLG